MAYTAVATAVTGQTYLASSWNTEVKDNFSALWQYTTAGDIVYATSATTLARRGIGSEGQVLTVTSGVPTWGQGFPSGAVLDYAGASVPSGWLDCNGAAVSRTTYSALYSAIGTTFGSGDGLTTFNLPDFRGRASIGVGTGTGLTARTLAATTGAETHTLITGEMPSHTHVQNAHSHSIQTYFNRPGVASGSFAAAWNDLSSTTTGSTTATNQNTGGGGAHNNMQPSLAVYKIIKV